MKNFNHYPIDHHISGNNLHNHNLAKGVICEFRRKWYHVIVRQCVPEKLREYVYV